MKYRHHPAALLLVAITAFLLMPGISLASGPDEAVTRRIESLQAGYPVRILGEPLIAREALRRFYESHGFQLAWSSPEHRRQLAKAIQQIANDGLNPSDYHGDFLLELTRRARDDLSPDMQADLDLLFTDAFLLAGSHLLDGKVNPHTISAQWNVTRREQDMAVILARALRNDAIADTLDELRPRYPAYRRLMTAREELTRLLGKAWLTIPSGPSIHPGDTDVRLQEIRRRLALLGDSGGAWQQGADPAIYDKDLENIIPDFQARHGLEPDGIVGSKTLAALNLMPVERVRQIDASLERWRWLPEFLGDTYVLVNIAAFELQMIDNGTEVLRRQVIVGRPYRQTPLFSDRIRYLVFNPTWTIPRKLMIEDQLPEILRDPEYLNRMNISVYRGWGADRQRVDPATVDWASLSGDNFPFQLVQEPGPRNALGQVKFMFPNRYDVYLHDTPGQYLFGRQARTFSSGCIRVENPFEFANLLMANHPDWSPQTIDELLTRQTPVTILLPTPVPIHIQYWTTWVDEQDRIQFRNDIYHRDSRLIRELRKSRSGGEQRLTPVTGP